MIIFSSISSYLNILASNYAAGFLNLILLTIAEGIYRVVAVAYQVFNFMCQMNLNVMIGSMSGLITRVKALIIVLVIFKLGLSLVQNIMNPDNAMAAGKQLLINILICSALLVSYNFIFGVANEVGMLIIGSPADYKYTYLKRIAGVSDGGDSGLLMRLFFGSSANVLGDSAADLGKTMAVQSLCITFQDNNSDTCNTLESVLSKGGESWDLKKISNLNPYLGREIDGHPFIAIIVGGYIIYSLVYGSVQIGIRMFKLAVLQMVAPLAIISIISTEGVKSDLFKKYRQMYVSIFISAFTRIISILLVTVFITSILGNIGGTISTVTSAKGIVKIIVLALIIVAGYQFAGQFPKMIEQLLGKVMETDGNGNFGKFLGNLATGAAGGAVGFATGVAHGEGGLGNRLMSGAVGASEGVAASNKGNSVAEKFKNINESRGTIKNKAGAISEMGAGAYLAGAAQSRIPFAGAKAQEEKVAAFDKAAAGYDKEMEKVNASEKDYDAVGSIISAYDNAQIQGVKDQAAGSGTGLSGFAGYGSSGIKYGTDREAYAQSLLKYNQEFNNKTAAYEAAKSSGDQTRIASAQLDLQQARDKALKAARSDWDAAKSNVDNEDTRYLQERFKEETAKLDFGGSKQELSLGSTSNPSAHQYTISDAKTLLGSEKARLGKEKDDITRNKNEVLGKKKDFMNSDKYKNIKGYNNIRNNNL